MDERFVAVLYSRTSECKFVNESRKKLICATGRQIENIPSAQDVLIQHRKRAIYQGIYIWNTTFMPQHDVPSPAAWGWKRKED